MFRFKTRYLLCAMAAALALPAVTQADVRLPRVISSNMVLQQDKPVVLWGWADKGEAVTVQIGDKKESTKATDKGEWQVKLPALKASSTPISIIVTGNNTLKLDNVLVGEVWLCSGQSNMEMGIKAILNADQEVKEANYPNIRLFKIPKAYNTLPQDEVPNAAGVSWDICSPETIVKSGWGGFSAAGYFFGRELHKTLGVPIGLIDSSWGGTRIEPWTPPEGFAEISTLKDISNKVALADPRTDAHKKKLEEVLKTTEAWIATARKAGVEEKVVPAMPTFPSEISPLSNHQQPTALFNSMISPIVPLSMRGAIWYQGEANHGEGKMYTEKTKALVAGWRKVFNQPDLAYYYVQIAPFQYGNENSNVLAEFWEAQAAAMTIPNTGMVVTTDISDLKDIHPKNKQEVGRRLALWALAKTYGKNDVAYSGPVYKSLTAEGGKLRVTFDYVAGGLQSRDGKPLSHFEIIDEEKGGFVPAKAEIDGSSIVLSADGVSKPVAVRFGWHKLAEPNLANKAGLPAIPFRAGNVPDRDALTLNVDEARDYQLVYDLDLSKLKNGFTYDIDNQARIAKPIERIAYFLELTAEDGKEQYVYVSMDAFTKELSKIGIPTAASKATFQQRVNNMNVVTNVANVASGTGLKGGFIEFWPNNYGPVNATNVPGADSRNYDFGDQVTNPVDGYGSMQVHNIDAKQTIFAINNWKAGSGGDLGIGNAPGTNTDWTFAKNVGKYQVKRLRVLVK